MDVVFELDTFDRALKENARKYHEAARPAAQAAAQVIYDLARLNVPVSSKGHWFHGTSFRKTGQKYWFDPGSLRSAIYQAYSKDQSTASKATYHISWNATKAPYGYMVEFGTSRAHAHSFLGRAIVEGRQQAIEAMRSRFIQEVSK